MKNVVIIGAGPAGLTAAYTLLNESSEYHPIIIEASEFIGGISRTARYNGNRIDIGGHISSRFRARPQRTTRCSAERTPFPTTRR